MDTLTADSNDGLGEQDGLVGGEEFEATIMPSILEGRLFDGEERLDCGGDIPIVFRPQVLHGADRIVSCLEIIHEQ